MQYLLFLILTVFFNFSYAENYNLSLCAIFQNEAPYLKEWIDYHKKVGVEHFWLYSNNSTDEYKEVLKPYIESGIVHLIEWNFSYQDVSEFNFKIQSPAYTDAISRSRGVSKWLAIIDSDEFIVPVCEKNIINVLENNFSNCSGVSINWQCYGTSNVKKCKSILKELVYKMKWDDEHNKYSKCIVQPLHVEYCPNPHYCIYKDGHWAVDTNKKYTPICCSSINLDILRINHYWTRDEDFLWNHKIPRYLKWHNSVEKVLEHANRMNEEYDPILAY